MDTEPLRTPPHRLNSLKRGKIKCVTELQIQHSPLHPHSFRTPPPLQHTLTHNYLGTIGKLCHHGNGLWGSGQEQLLHQINSDSDNPSSFLTIHTHCTTSLPPSLKFACCSQSLSPSLVCPSCPPPPPSRWPSNPFASRGSPDWKSSGAGSGWTDRYG